MLNQVLNVAKENLFEILLGIATIFAVFTGKKTKLDKLSKKIETLTNKQVKTVQKMEKRQEKIDTLKGEKENVKNNETGNS